MELFIKNVKISNFRKFVSEVEFNFTDKLNVFNGVNGTGKTTILSAITWCLFGYNIDGKNVSNFTIYSIIDGVEQTDLKPTVQVEFSNGIVLKRSFAKDKTSYYVGNYDETGALNFVKYKNKAEFNNFVADKIIDTDSWEKLSNLEKLPTMKWTELKELVFNLLGGVEDDVILANGDYSMIESDVRLHGAEEMHSNYKNSKSSIKEIIKEKESIIKYNKDSKDVVLKESSVEELKEQKSKNDKVLGEYQTNVNGYNDRKREVETHNNQYIIKLDMKTRKQNTIDSNTKTIEQYKSLYSDSAFDGEQARQKDLVNIDNDESKINFNIGTQRNEIKGLDSRIKGVQSDINDLTSKNVKLIAEGNELQSVEVKLNSDNCNTCSQPLPEEMKASALKNLRDARDLEASKIMDKINYNKKSKEAMNNTITEYNSLIEKCKTKIAELSSSLHDLDAKRKVIGEKEYLSTEETPKQKQYREIYEGTHKKNTKLEKEIAAIDVELENFVKLQFTESEIESPTEIQEQNELIAVSLSKISNHDLEIDLHSKELDKLADKLIIIDKKIQQMVTFKAAKSKMITDRIKEEFQMVEFITSEVQKNGDTVETFKIAYGGKEYRDLSTGEKIRVVLDLVMGIQRLKGIRIPILIDKMESVTDIGEILTQVIGTRVTRSGDLELVTETDEYVQERTEEVPMGLKVKAVVEGEEIDITEHTKEFTKEDVESFDKLKVARKEEKNKDESFEGKQLPFMDIEA